jgi:hypothetical protein
MSRDQREYDAAMRRRMRGGRRPSPEWRETGRERQWQGRGPGREPSPLAMRAEPGPQRGGRPRGYDADARRFGYGREGLYGGSMYGGGRYGRDYLGAWGPGGWSAEHGREHSGVTRSDRYGRDFRRGPWSFPDEAPTG